MIAVERGSTFGVRLPSITAYRVIVAGSRGEFAAALPGGADSDEERLASVARTVIVAGWRGEFAAALPGGAHSDDDRLGYVGSAADVAEGSTMTSMAPASSTTGSRRSIVDPLLPEDSGALRYGSEL
jgi:hypothetical protein